MRCAIFGCDSDNQSKKKPCPGIKFFHFPKDNIFLKKWIHATGRKDKFNVKNCVVCSKHFDQSDFKINLQHQLLNYTPSRYRGLKDDAVPSLNLPHLIPKTLKQVSTSIRRDIAIKRKAQKEELNKLLENKMVTCCVAYGCKNEQDGRKKIPFHTFPFKRPEVLKLWIKSIRRDKWYPSNTSRLCGDHFRSTDYKTGSNSVLKLDAVPSVFSFPKHLMPKLVRPRRKIIKVQSTTTKTVRKASCDEPLVFEKSDSSIPCSSSTVTELTQTPSFIDQSSQTVPDNKVAILQKKINSLQQQVSRNNIEISTMTDIIRILAKKGYFYDVF